MDNNTRFVIARNIKYRRISMNIRQVDLAKAIHYSQDWMCRFEKGNGGSIPAECLPAIAKELQTTITDLYIPGRFYVDK